MLSSIHIVTQEEVADSGRVTKRLEDHHQVPILTVDVAEKCKR